jgi:hypothetical protein
VLQTAEEVKAMDVELTEMNRRLHVLKIAIMGTARDFLGKSSFC